ncbi:MAG: ribonuclease P protein component [Bacteroidaceae bacterium]|nr:ribonuclease P protein component [Bacteroidaceae bacterium]
MIDDVFVNGHRLLVFPFSVRWTAAEPVEGRPPVQVLLTVSKRRFKHAVDRNRVKRLMRECFRLNKTELHAALAAKGLHLRLTVGYVHSELPEFHTLQERWRKLVSALVREVDAKTRTSAERQQPEEGGTA